MKRLALVVAGGVAALWLLSVLGYDVTIGGYVLGPEGLGRLQAKGHRKSRIIVGGCVIAPNVDPASLVDVIPSLIVVGGFVADRSVGDAYGDRLKVIGGASLRAPRSSEQGDLAFS